MKRLYSFMLQRFLPMLLMTFFICLFILLMQFLWRYLDDLVGKGLAFSVIAELMFYASLTLVPMALPLAILLASLMTFGNLGEKFELTALKAAGISLFRIMKPLIILIVFISVGGFFFQNDILPIAQTKMWTLLFSMRQKSPEVEIPERSFYDQLPNMNLYVERKNPDTGMLYEMIIYSTMNGIDNPQVILADSGKFNFTEDKTHLFIHLYNGEMFENLRNSDVGNKRGGNMPFRRESFEDKQIYFAFDANFNRLDEDQMRRQYIGKNTRELKHSIDSIQLEVDSIGDAYATDLKTNRYVHMPIYERVRTDSDSYLVPLPAITLSDKIDLDTVLNAPNPSMAKSYVSQALTKMQQTRDNYEYRRMMLGGTEKIMRRHGIEMHKKFTLSFACLIFFFIGAPLGAIIKKGGIGTPLVISVFLFIFYYIIDNTGYKMARDGKMEVWEGIWLSSAVLLPLGIFFTYKAIGDSQVFNIDAYINFFNRLRGIRPKRTLEPKEVVMTEVDDSKAIDMLKAFIEQAKATQLGAHKRNLIKRLLGLPTLTELNNTLNSLIDYLSNSRNKRVIALLNNYPFDLNYRDLADVIMNSHHILKYFNPKDSVSTDNDFLPIEDDGSTPIKTTEDGHNA